MTDLSYLGFLSRRAFGQARGTIRGHFLLAPVVLVKGSCHTGSACSKPHQPFYPDLAHSQSAQNIGAILFALLASPAVSKLAHSILIYFISSYKPLTYASFQSNTLPVHFGQTHHRHTRRNSSLEVSISRCRPNLSVEHHFRIN